jgi:hypothetical protein
VGVRDGSVTRLLLQHFREQSLDPNPEHGGPLSTRSDLDPAVGCDALLVQVGVMEFDPEEGNYGASASPNVGHDRIQSVERRGVRVPAERHQIDPESCQP